MKFQDKIICERCQVAMTKTTIENVWKCPVCGVIENKRLER
jgi:ribosomal protein L37AE/L43A|tara:strand:+ start:255 stop:377 length:123 start_codon:yes stop_codon:yes gene_type:complete